MTQENRERVERAARYAADLCMRTGKDQGFYDAFWERLLSHGDILAEFIYYMEKGRFRCRASVGSVTVADILVWQIDRFKAVMDQDRTALGQDPDEMVLRAFDTMTKMAEDPQRYTMQMAADTGTDYPGKFGGL